MNGPPFLPESLDKFCVCLEVYVGGVLVSQTLAQELPDATAASDNDVAFNFRVIDGDGFNRVSFSNRSSRTPLAQQSVRCPG